jgi:hypothetical protein
MRRVVTTSPVCTSTSRSRSGATPTMNRVPPPGKRFGLLLRTTTATPFAIALLVGAHDCCIEPSTCAKMQRTPLPGINQNSPGIRTGSCRARSQLVPCRGLRIMRLIFSGSGSGDVRSNENLATCRGCALRKTLKERCSGLTTPPSSARLTMRDPGTTVRAGSSRPSVCQRAIPLNRPAHASRPAPRRRPAWAAI